MILNNRLLSSAVLGIFITSISSTCASRPPENPNTAGAYAILNSRNAIKSVTVVEMAGRKPLYSFSKGQCDSLKSALKSAFVSESLLLTPSPWEVALVIRTGADTPFVALYYGDVLRVNASYPWTTRIADSTGAVPVPGIADIILDGDDVSWLFRLMEKVMGTEPSKPYLVPRMLPQWNPD